MSHEDNFAERQHTGGVLEDRGAAVRELARSVRPRGWRWSLAGGFAGRQPVGLLPGDLLR